MISTPTLRRPVLDDAEAIARVHVDSWRETYSRLLPEEFFDATALQQRRRMWRRTLERGTSERCWVAQDDERIVGFGLAATTRDEGRARDLQLFMLYVLHQFHGTGTGHALLDAVLGTAPAQLWVAAQNAHAILFYERHGFRPDSVEKHDERIGNIHEIRMVR